MDLVLGPVTPRIPGAITDAGEAEECGDDANGRTKFGAFDDRGKKSGHNGDAAETEGCSDEDD